MRLGPIHSNRDAKAICKLLHLDEPRKNLGEGHISHLPNVGEKLKLFTKDEITNENIFVETSTIKKVQMRGQPAMKNQIYLVKTTNTKYLLQILE
jgi:phosphohistidine phosphatase SixA